MERFLRDWKTCDMTLIWQAQLDDKLPKVPRRRLENVKQGKIITKDFSQLIDDNSLAIGKWGYILFGTCVIQKKKLAYLLVDSRKLLTRISTAGRTDFKIPKKKIPKAAQIDENFEIPEINLEDLTDIMNGNTARPQDITLRERREEFLTFDEEMLDFSNTLAINLDDPEQIRHVQDLFEQTNDIGDGPSFQSTKQQDLSANPTSSSVSPPQPEQPPVLDPTPDVPEPPAQENPLPSDKIPPPDQSADPPQNEAPRPSPDIFKLRELTSDEIRELKTPKNQRDGQPKPKRAKRNRALIIDGELECAEFNRLRKSKETDMHTNSGSNVADMLGFANEHCDHRDLKICNPWFGLEHITLRQLYSRPLFPIHGDIERSIDFSCVKNGKEIQRILNERNRDESNVPAGASGVAVNETGNSESGVANQTKQSTRLEQEMTVNQSDGHPTAPEDHLQSFQQAHGQPEVPEQSLQQDFPPPPAQNESIGRVPPSPPRPEIPSMASLNLNEPNSSRYERSSQYSFTSQDARQSLSFELTKTGQCTFEDVASKLKGRQQVASCFYQLLEMAKAEHVTVSQKEPFGEIKIRKNENYM